MCRCFVFTFYFLNFAKEASHHTHSFRPQPNICKLLIPVVVMSNTVRTILAVILAGALSLVAYPLLFQFITPYLIGLALGKGAFATIIAIIFGGWLLLMIADMLNEAAEYLVNDNIIAKILQTIIYLGGFIWCLVTMIPTLLFAGMWSIIASAALISMLVSVYYKGAVSVPWIKA